MLCEELRESCIVCVLDHNFNGFTEVIQILILYLIDVVLTKHHWIVNLSCFVQRPKITNRLLVECLILIFLSISKSFNDLNWRSRFDSLHVVW